MSSASRTRCGEASGGRVGGYLAIDLGGTNTRVGLVGPGGILARREFLTLVGEGPEAWLARLAGTAGELGSKARGLGLPVRALGLGTPVQGIPVDAPLSAR